MNNSFLRPYYEVWQLILSKNHTGRSALELSGEIDWVCSRMNGASIVHTPSVAEFTGSRWQLRSTGFGVKGTADYSKAKLSLLLSWVLTTLQKLEHAYAHGEASNVLMRTDCWLMYGV